MVEVSPSIIRELCIDMLETIVIESDQFRIGA